MAVLLASDLAAQTCTVDRDRELMIRDVSVVEDCARTTWGLCGESGSPNAAWTFGRLAEGLASTTDADRLSDFVLTWLSQWNAPRLINGHRVPRRTAVDKSIVEQWRAASGGGRLDMKKAPFRLLAIVSRLDLRRPPRDGRGSAGELRFIFVGTVTMNHTVFSLPFSMILEYELPAATCADQKEWARRFHRLGSLPFGSGFNSALQDITDRVTRMGAAPSRPNGSALSHIRTNEDSEIIWELREFALRPSPSTLGPAFVLLETTIAQTPGGEFNHAPELADYVNEFESEILDQTYVVPETFDGRPFRAGAALNGLDGDLPMFWEAPGIHNNEARHLLSMNTCNGCHGAETGTFFQQVGGSFPGTRAVISGFLGGEDGAGMDVADPVDGTVRHFNELEFRGDDLCRLLEESCAELAKDAPRSRVH